MFLRKYCTESIIALAAVVIAACWWPIRMRFPFDDTYITFRYAANLAHGFGIVWNAGTIVVPTGAHTEGYTNFLFVLLLTPFVWLGCDLVIVSQVIGVVAVIISAIAIYRIVSCRGKWHLPDHGMERANAISPYSLFAIALFLLDPFIWMNAYSGLETSLFTMWLVLSLWAFTTKRTELAFMLATFAALTRPEGALMGMVLLIVALKQKLQNPNEEIPATLEDHAPVSVLSYWVSAFVLPLVLYAGWKFWYFGNVLPNSFYIKVAQITGALFLPGRGTMRIFYTGLWYLLPFGIIAVWKGRRNAAVQIAALWCWLLSGFYLFSQLIQNDYQRFTNSIEVMLIVLAGIAIGSMTQKRWVASVAMIVVIAASIIWSLYFRGGLGYIQRMNEELNPYSRVAKVFKSIPDHEEVTLAWGDAGRLPYYSGLRNIDPVGLNTNEIAHAHSAGEVIAFIMKSKPDMIIIPLILPKDDTIPNDTCHRVLGHGHGLIGSAYPALAAVALANGYVPIATMPQTIYDLDILADTMSVHYPDIYHTLVPRIGKDPDFLPPVTNIK
jgi:arabinofuranosyltransferase